MFIRDSLLKMISPPAVAGRLKGCLHGCKNFCRLVVRLRTIGWILSRDASSPRLHYPTDVFVKWS